MSGTGTHHLYFDFCHPLPRSQPLRQLNGAPGFSSEVKREPPNHRYSPYHSFPCDEMALTWKIYKRESAKSSFQQEIKNELEKRFKWRFTPWEQPIQNLSMGLKGLMKSLHPSWEVPSIRQLRGTKSAGFHWERSSWEASHTNRFALYPCTPWLY